MNRQISKLNSSFVISITLLIVLSGACAPSKVSVRPNDNVFISHNNSAVLAPIIIKHVSIENDAELDFPERNEAFAMEIKKEINNVLNEKGLMIHDLISLVPENEALATYETDLAFFNKFFYTDIDDKSRALLNQLNGTPLLVVSIVVSIGAQGSWNPWSGAITSGMSRTKIRAVLIDTGKEGRIWQNEVLLREVPQIGSGNFNKAVAMLFLNLKTKEEN